MSTRLDSEYIPKPNDHVVLSNVGKRLSTLADDANSLKENIKQEDVSLFDENGRHFKLPWNSFSHTCNLALLEEVTQLCSKIHELKEQCEITAARFRKIAGTRKGGSSSSLEKKKKRKNTKKNQKKVSQRFNRNVEKLLCTICSHDIQAYIAKGIPIPDYEITVDREESLSLTKAKLKHFVCMLDYFDHHARCTLLDLVPAKLGKDLLLVMEKEELDRSSGEKDDQSNYEAQDSADESQDSADESQNSTDESQAS